ncbi:MAG: hypothetical protein FJ024_09555 [Chloroflexi bacterium]|nr:hypothetical protein [Chloroflexota bacterium]
MSIYMDVAPATFHSRVVASPAGMLAGLATKEMITGWVGVGGGEGGVKEGVEGGDAGGGVGGEVGGVAMPTATVTDLVTLPAAFLAVRV